MPPRAALTGPELAAGHLQALLAKPGRYRDRWVRRADKPRDDRVSQAAVARVIAEYLRQRNGVDTSEVIYYRRLKDRVHRALTAYDLSTETLEYFIQAFMMSDDDARQLWAHYTGGSPSYVDRIVQELGIPPTEGAAFQRPKYETILLRETHILGPDGTPQEHRIRQVVRCVGDGLSRFPVRFDSGAVTVDVSRGNASDIYKCGPGLHAVDILLPAELKKGESVETEYTFRFLAAPLGQNFKRAALRRIENVEIVVAFHRSRLPDDVRWATWADYLGDDPPQTSEPVRLDRQGRARKVLLFAERTVVGFAWTWGDRSTPRDTHTENHGGLQREDRGPSTLS